MKKRIMKRMIKQLGYNQLSKKFFGEFYETKLKPCLFAGGISLEEGRFLVKLTQKANNIEGPIVEIGTLFGHSTQVICLVKEPNKKVFTVDNFRWNPLGLSSDEQFSLTKENLQEVIDSHNVEIARMEKRNFYERYSDKPPALVFFDADHSYESTLEDLLWAKRVDAKIICGHDYKESMPGVVRAVNQVSGGRPRELCQSLFLL